MISVVIKFQAQKFTGTSFFSPFFTLSKIYWLLMCMQGCGLPGYDYITDYYSFIILIITLLITQHAISHHYKNFWPYRHTVTRRIQQLQVYKFYYILLNGTQIVIWMFFDLVKQWTNHFHVVVCIRVYIYYSFVSNIYRYFYGFSSLTFFVTFYQCIV